MKSYDSFVISFVDDCEIFAEYKNFEKEERDNFYI